ncbi:uncharacterized protein F4822DRAFT_431054 [Hypoxylon trugodes]|uniref:uncharacterized protein n=1 Tax=Hypoxylon trugodes TaxID=326681 RepID=UPI00218F59E7|nr:uncharacterized protein F4822DRAFT_431054 [Hypoxylon trugodes]KAI1386180.1 hypothetical protein F4822DRAFT_431054 [Hypoxylon trugodes]
MATQAMSDLSLDTRDTRAKIKSKAKKPAPVADSWEDEDVDEEEPSSKEPDIVLPPSSPSVEKNGLKVDGSGFNAPPPTPISPSVSSTSTPPWQGPISPISEEGGRRPEKTDAVARRMIASALGVRAPRPTEEQRAYDRAVREKERKRREEEKEAEKRRKEEAERAKAAIWED